MNKDFTLVMTASVNPNGMTGISAQSVNGREDQYIRTLRFYRDTDCIPKILFVENSNWDLTRIKNALGKTDKIEYLSLDDNTYPREWGKGYGEFKLLDAAVDHLTAQTSSSSDTGGGDMVKVTGRFPVLNISTMIREFQARKNLKLAVDVVDHPLYDWLRLGWCGHSCRTIVYAISLPFYRQHLYGRYVEIPSRFFGAEGLMLDVYKETKKEKGVYPRLRHEPHLSGYAGAVNSVWFTANNYDGLLARTKRGVRQLGRWLLPFLWL